MAEAKKKKDAKKPEVIDNKEPVPTALVPASGTGKPALARPEPDRRLSPLEMPPEQFRAILERQGENRTNLVEWVREGLVEGVDFGRIHFVKKDNCMQFAQTGTCDSEKHWSKPSLWKPGAEKICGMLQVMPTYPRLAEYEQIAIDGKTVNNIIIRCEIVNQQGQVLAEGVGARSLKQDYNDLNKSMKMAMKSAQIDASLRLAGLSEVFTQDIEDMQANEDKPTNGDTIPYWVSTLWGQAREAGMPSDVWSGFRQEMTIEDWHRATSGQIGGMHGKVRAWMKKNGTQPPKKESPPKEAPKDNPPHDDPSQPISKTDAKNLEDTIKKKIADIEPLTWVNNVLAVNDTKPVESFTQIVVDDCAYMHSLMKNMPDVEQDAKPEPVKEEEPGSEPVSEYQLKEITDAFANAMGITEPKSILPFLRSALGKQFPEVKKMEKLESLTVAMHFAILERLGNQFGDKSKQTNA